MGPSQQVFLMLPFMLMGTCEGATVIRKKDEPVTTYHGSQNSDGVNIPVRKRAVSVGITADGHTDTVYNIATSKGVIGSTPEGDGTRSARIQLDGEVQEKVVDAGKHKRSQVILVKAAFPVRDSIGNLLEKANFKSTLLAEAVTSNTTGFTVDVFEQSANDVVINGDEEMVDGMLGTLSNGNSVLLFSTSSDAHLLATPSGTYTCYGAPPTGKQVALTNCALIGAATSVAQIDAQSNDTPESTEKSVDAGLPFYPGEVIHTMLNEHYDDNQHDLVAEQIAHVVRQSDPTSLILVDKRIVNKVLSLLADVDESMPFEEDGQSLLSDRVVGGRFWFKTLTGLR